MKIWEYKILAIDYDDKEKRLKGLRDLRDLGAEGWELVSVAVNYESDKGSSFNRRHYLYFKREFLD